MKTLERQLREGREAYEAAQGIEDVNDRRREGGNPVAGSALLLGEGGERPSSVPDPTSSEVVAFGSTVTFKRNDGRVQQYRIVGEGEADPKAGSISFASPVAKSLMGKGVGDVAGAGSQELEIVAIS